MLTILILVCSVADPSGYGCAPRTAVNKVVVGKAATEAECFMTGRKAIAKYVDTDKVFHKVVCTVP